MDRQEKLKARFWPKLRANLARVPFAEKLLAVYFCAMDPATPLKARGTLYAALAYFILPIDAVPDLLMGLGFTDDLAVLMTAIGIISRHLKPGHEDRAREALARLRHGDITE